MESVFTDIYMEGDGEVRRYIRVQQPRNKGTTNYFVITCTSSSELRYYSPIILLP